MDDGRGRTPADLPALLTDRLGAELLDLADERPELRLLTELDSRGTGGAAVTRATSDMH